MNRHLQKITSDMRDVRVQTWGWFKELSRWKQAGVILILIALVFLFGRALRKTPQTEEQVKANRAVQVASVGDLSRNDVPLPLLGTVTSRSEATIRAESSGKLTVYHKLGDYVGAGEIIAQFENAAERASVLQAEGAYESAKASRDIAAINTSSSGVGLVQAKVQALNTLFSAYTSLDDAVRSKSDGVFKNPQNSQIKFLINVPDQALVLNIERERSQIEQMLVARDARNRTLTQSSDMLAELNTIETEVTTIKNYLDDLSSALSKAIPDTTFSQSALDGLRASVNGARAEVGGTLTSITGARSSLNASLTASQVASTNFDTTGQSANTASADAQVKQALGALASAQARLEKTVVRSPISGTLNSLSVSTGDFVSNFTEIAVVSNNGALEVLAYLTEDDAKGVTVGNKVKIEGQIDGIVTKIAPALDPKTKKIEMRIGITGSATSLLNGQSVRVSVLRAKANDTNDTVVKAPLQHIQIPISALKITPQGSLVFTLDENNKLVPHMVKEGMLLGDQITILDGLTEDMKIVTDARGLKAGMAVTVSH